MSILAHVDRYLHRETLIGGEHAKTGEVPQGAEVMAQKRSNQLKENKDHSSHKRYGL